MSQQESNSQQQEKDQLLIDDAVIEKITGIAMRDVKGILGMKGSLMSGFASSFGAAASPSKGVTATVDGQYVTVEIRVILEYGASATEVFEQVRKLVRDEIRVMTGLSVRDIQLRVVDVMTQAEYDRDNKDAAKAASAQSKVPDGTSVITRA